MFDLFDTSNFIPRKACGNWSDELIWTHNLADLAIFGAYLTIPVMLVAFTLKKKRLPFPGLFYMFALFIIGCGCTHLMAFFVFQWPAYYLDAAIKIVTAVVSWATVLYMLPMIPQFLNMRTPAEFQEELLQKKKAEALLQDKTDELQRHQLQLEKLVANRTEELQKTNDLLKAQIDERRRVGDELGNHAKKLVALQKTTVETLAILDSLMQLAPVGMAFLDNDRRYVRINNCLASINGIPIAEHIGRRVEDILPELAKTLKRKLDQVYISGSPVIHDEVVGCTPGTHGKEHAWHTSYYPVYTPDNRVLGVGIVVVDVTDQKNLERELRQRVKELAESDHHKSDFLAMLSHEMRNPLAPILNSVYNLEMTAKEEEDHIEVLPDVATYKRWFGERHKAREMIRRQVRHLSRLLDDLLDVARLNRGKIKLKKEPVNLWPLITNAIENNREGIETRHHEIKLSGDTNLIVNADATRMEQVFNNIINNAIKYTEPGGVITIQSSHKDDWIVISFKDDGIGIAHETLPKLFEIFAQAARSLDRAQGGLGIGLSLSQDLIRMHGGSILARSDGLGLGTEFVIRVPILHDLDVITHIDKSKIVKASRSLQILIVDDNPDAAESLCVLLKATGHDCQMVYDGATALKKVNVYRPEVILLDIGLPSLDGYTVCSLLRESGFKGLIVAVTGYGSIEDREKSHKAGFDHHLVKPVTLEEISGLLAKYAERVVQ